MTTSFASLPIEIQQVIFFELPISEVLHRCKLVCKSWRGTINLMRYRSLTIQKKYSYCSQIKDFNSLANADPGLLRYIQGLNPGFPGKLKYEFIVTNFLVNLKCAHSLSQLHQQTIFKTVKTMTTSFANLPDFTVLSEFYNHFEWLESLTFDSKRVIGTALAAKIVLDLKWLRKLIVHSDQFEFHLKTPNLTSFQTIRQDDLNVYFEFPERLVHLEADECYEGLRFPSEFTNLTTLVVQKSLSVHSFPDFLEKVSSLKQLFFGFNYSGLPELTASLDQRPKLDIFVLGIPHDHLRYDPPNFVQPNVSIYVKMRRLSESLSLMNERSHCEFEIEQRQMQWLSSEQMDELNKKVEKVSNLLLNCEPTNEEALLEFLRTKSPFLLQIDIPNFGSSFLERMPASCQLLREICVYSQAIDLNGQLFGFEFLFKLENLARIEILNAFSVSFAVKLLETKKSLEYLRFFSYPVELFIKKNFTLNTMHLKQSYHPHKFLFFAKEQTLMDHMRIMRDEFAGPLDNQFETFYLRGGISKNALELEFKNWENMRPKKDCVAFLE